MYLLHIFIGYISVLLVLYHSLITLNFCAWSSLSSSDDHLTWVRKVMLVIVNSEVYHSDDVSEFGIFPPILIRCRSQWPGGLSPWSWSLDRRDCGFESCLSMDVCLCVYMLCVGRGFCDGLITHPKVSYRMSKKPQRGAYIPARKHGKLNKIPYRPW
jgi:hypothetical protein